MRLTTAAGPISAGATIGPVSAGQAVSCRVVRGGLEPPPPRFSGPQTGVRRHPLLSIPPAQSHDRVQRHPPGSAENRALGCQLGCQADGPSRGGLTVRCSDLGLGGVGNPLCDLGADRLVSGASDVVGHLSHHGTPCCRGSAVGRLRARSRLWRRTRRTGRLSSINSCGGGRERRHPAPAPGCGLRHAAVKLVSGS